jgi:hypothetical protein
MNLFMIALLIELRRLSIRVRVTIGWIALYLQGALR